MNRLSERILTASELRKPRGLLQVLQLLKLLDSILD
jgi:hypothetical protein